MATNYFDLPKNCFGQVATSVLDNASELWVDHY